MVHPKQYLEQAARKAAADNAVPIKEAMECLDRHDVLSAWFAESIPWLMRGAMRASWWNAVLNEPQALAFVQRWAKDCPDDARKYGHDYALAIRLAPKPVPA